MGNWTYFHLKKGTCCMWHCVLHVVSLASGYYWSREYPGVRGWGVRSSSPRTGLHHLDSAAVTSADHGSLAIRFGSHSFCNDLGCKPLSSLVLNRPHVFSVRLFRLLLWMKLIIWFLSGGCECGVNPDNIGIPPEQSNPKSTWVPPLLSAFQIKANSYQWDIFGKRSGWDHD